MRSEKKNRSCKKHGGSAYEAWGDVVFFYGDYNENPGLFELGQVVSGGDLISQMSGTITLEAAE